MAAAENGSKPAIVAGVGGSPSAQAAYAEKEPPDPHEAVPG